MSNHDSGRGRPPPRERRMILRKIGSTDRDSVPDDGVDAAARLSAPAPQPAGAPSSYAPYETPSSMPDAAGPVARPSHTQASLPPLVANVGERSRATSPPVAQGTSTARASLVGAAAGLAFVAMIVIGARLAYQEPHDAAQASGGRPGASAVTAGEGFAAPSPSAAVTANPPNPLPIALPPTTIASPAFPAAPKRPLAPKPAAVAGGAMVPAVVAAKGPSEPGAPASETTSKGKPPGAAAAAAPSSSSASAEPADSAPSLVPVIPSSAPPEMDPLVKAVLEDDHK